MYHSYVNVINSTFQRNSAADKGAAIYAAKNYFMLVSGCLFKDNTAKKGGRIKI